MRFYDSRLLVLSSMLSVVDEALNLLFILSNPSVLDVNKKVREPSFEVAN